MSLTNVAENLQVGSKTLPNVGEECLLSSHTLSNIPRTSNICATKVLELVHFNVCGPIETVPKGGARYFVNFIDHFSK